jgi:hypothetical protein
LLTETSIQKLVAADWSDAGADDSEESEEADADDADDLEETASGN